MPLPRSQAFRKFFLALLLALSPAFFNTQAHAIAQSPTTCAEDLAYFLHLAESVPPADSGASFHADWMEWRRLSEVTLGDYLHGESEVTYGSSGKVFKVKTMTEDDKAAFDRDFRKLINYREHWEKYTMGAELRAWWLKNGEEKIDELNNPIFMNATRRSNQRLLDIQNIVLAQKVIGLSHKGGPGMVKRALKILRPTTKTVLTGAALWVAAETFNYLVIEKVKKAATKEIASIAGHKDEAPTSQPVTTLELKPNDDQLALQTDWIQKGQRVRAVHKNLASLEKWLEAQNFEKKSADETFKAWNSYAAQMTKFARQEQQSLPEKLRADPETFKAIATQTPITFAADLEKFDSDYVHHSDALTKLIQIKADHHGLLSIAEQKLLKDENDLKVEALKNLVSTLAEYQMTTILFPDAYPDASYQPYKDQIAKLFSSYVGSTVSFATFMTTYSAQIDTILNSMNLEYEILDEQGKVLHLDPKAVFAGDTGNERAPNSTARAKATTLPTSH